MVDNEPPDLTDFQVNLLEYVKEGKLDEVRNLLKIPGIDVNFSDLDENTALIYACEYGHLDIVKELLKHPDIHLNRSNNDGITPLIQAIIEEKPEIVELFLKDKRVNVDYSKGLNKSAIIYAIDKRPNDKSQKIIDLLLQHPDIDLYKEFWDEEKGELRSIEWFAKNAVVLRKLRIAKAVQTLGKIATKDERRRICSNFRRQDDRTLTAWIKKKNTTGLSNNVMNKIGREFLGGRRTRRVRKTRGTRKRY